MYIFHKLKEIYSTCSPTSTECIIARYILLNSKRMQQISLTDIARETAISKSAVSKFIHDISFGKGYQLFKNDYIFEIENLDIDTRNLIRHIDGFEKNIVYNDGVFKKNISQYIDLEEIKALTYLMKKANKIIFYGNISYKGYFNTLINYLLLQGKDIQFTCLFYMSHQNQQLHSLTHEDLIITVDENDIYENRMRKEIAVDVSNEIDLSCAQKYFIGKEMESHFSKHAIHMKRTYNIFLDHMLYEYMAAKILYFYIHE